MSVKIIRLSQGHRAEGAIKPSMPREAMAARRASWKGPVGAGRLRPAGIRPGAGAEPLVRRGSRRVADRADGQVVPARPTCRPVERRRLGCDLRRPGRPKNAGRAAGRLRPLRTGAGAGGGIRGEGAAARRYSRGPYREGVRDPLRPVRRRGRGRDRRRPRSPPRSRVSPLRCPRRRSRSSRASSPTQPIEPLSGCSSRRSVSFRSEPWCSSRAVKWVRFCRRIV